MIMVMKNILSKEVQLLRQRVWEDRQTLINSKEGAMIKEENLRIISSQNLKNGGLWKDLWRNSSRFLTELDLPQVSIHKMNLKNIKEK